MATTSSVPLDEIVHNRSDVIQWWVNDMGGQPMDENLIYRYVCESPFFDWTSNNGALFEQAQANMDLWQITLSRKAVEDFLRTRNGCEYMIVREPQPVADKALAAQGVKTGVWVIRKQERRRARDATSTTAPGVIVENGWELTTLATYYIIGENMYQAPSVADMIGNRLLSASSSLSRFIDTTNSLARFHPSVGYSYLPTTNKTPATVNTSSVGSPSQQSREGSIVPGTDGQSLRSTSLFPDSQQASGAAAASTTSAIHNARLLKTGLTMAIQFEDEYIDENPLQGEPGNFSFTSSAAAVKKRRAEEEEAAAAALAAAKARAQPSSTAESPADAAASAAVGSTVKATLPPAVFTDARTAGLKAEKAEKAERRGSKMGEKARRRKSRPAAATAASTAPGTPVPSTPA